MPSFKKKKLAQDVSEFKATSTLWSKYVSSLRGFFLVIGEHSVGRLNFSIFSASECRAPTMASALTVNILFLWSEAAKTIGLNKEH